MSGTSTLIRAFPPLSLSGRLESEVIRKDAGPAALATVASSRGPRLKSTANERDYPYSSSRRESRSKTSIILPV